MSKEMDGYNRFEILSIGTIYVHIGLLNIPERTLYFKDLYDLYLLI